MALPEIEKIDMNILNTWFSNVVDTINFDLGRISDEVPTLPNELTNIDSAPIQYLKDSLDQMVDNLNRAMEQIENRLAQLEQRGK